MIGFWKKHKNKTKRVLREDNDGLLLVTGSRKYKIKTHETFIRKGKPSWYIYDRHGETVVGDIASKEELEEFIDKLSNNAL